MLTRFTSPQSFAEPRFAPIQRNAIRSWRALEPPLQIIVSGNDEGVADIARECPLLHVPDVESDGRGVPIRSAMRGLAGRVARHELLCIINADGIALPTFDRRFIERAGDAPLRESDVRTAPARSCVQDEAGRRGEP